MRRTQIMRFLPSLIVACALLWGGALPSALAAEASLKQVTYADVVPLVGIPKPPKVQIIDVRPYESQFVNGYIPSAANLPEASFDAQASAILPKDKSSRLIFYGEGGKSQDNKSVEQAARKARALGYSDVAVYTGGLADWLAKGGVPSVGVENLKQLLDKNEPYILVDSRPFKRYGEGTIPSAISIPDSQFDKRKGMLPIDKNMRLIFFCGGYECVLSHDSAMRAQKLGYTNVAECEAGYPAWKKLYGGAAPAKKDTGKVEEGVFPYGNFEKYLNEGKPAILLVDVRPAAEFKAGSLPGAINITVDQLESKLAQLPKDKPVVFFCTTGARAGEAYYLVKDKDPKATNFYYLEAEISFKDGSYTITPNK